MVFEHFSNELQKRLSDIRGLSLDVDGVLTTGSIYYTPNGEEIKQFHAHDGFGIQAVQKLGVPVVIISGRKSTSVQKRVSELGIVHVYQGISDKLICLNEFCERVQLQPSQIAHIGDDVPDLCLFDVVGVSVSVADAIPEVIDRADIVTTRPGGHGAVREFCDLLVESCLS